MLGVPPETMTIAIMKRPNGTAYFELRVRRAGVDHIAPLYPELQRGLAKLDELDDL